MAITRTYAVGQNGTVRRLDNHTGPWIDISPPAGIAGTWTVYDVMADPSNPDNVTIVGEAIGGYSGILTSTNAGASWNIPAGTWDSPKIWYEVWYVDSNTIWATGQSGSVAKSIDGGLTFDLTTNIPTVSALTNTIHAISDQVAVVVASRAELTTNTVCHVWKTIDGGFSWFLLNGGANLIDIPAIGWGEGIWISDDQQTIIVGTSGGQNVSIDGGATFNAIAPTMTGSGRHLTWSPSHGAPAFFRHVGGEDFHVNESTDTGTTFTDLRSGEDITIRGAHFYSNYNGYYITGRTIYTSNDGGVTGTVSEIVSGTELMNAVWTTPAPTIYRLIDCTGALADIYSTSPLLAPMVGLVININVPFGEPVPADTCWQVEEAIDEGQTLTFVTGTTSYDDCITCLPTPSEDICWDLVSCNGLCDDLLSVTGLTFIDPPLPGALHTINGDTSCIYELYPIRQGMYINLQSSNLSNPTSAFQLGTENIILECASLIYNGVEYVTTPFSYTLTNGNYQVVECTGLNCVPVPVNTTENCIDNTRLFLNTIFSALGLPLEAYSDDPTHCGFGCGGPGNPGGKPGVCSEMFRIQYRDGDTFTITFSKTDNSGTSIGLLEVLTGNLSTQTDLGLGAVVETCNADVYCPLVEQPSIQSIEAWDGECIPLIPPTQPEIGEACDTTPRLGEPGFSVKNCDPKKVVAIKTNYADSVYALFKRMRYGIETCCEFDLDKIDVKNQLIDLGSIYDPDLCIPGQPVPNGCCPQPCNSIATLIVPLTSTCPVPTNTVAVLALAPQSCEAPSGAVADLVIP